MNINIKDRWNSFKKIKETDLKSMIPNLKGLDGITVKSEKLNSRITKVIFDNLNTAVDKTTGIATIKNAIVEYLKTFADVKIEPTSIENLSVHLFNFKTTPNNYESFSEGIATTVSRTKSAQTTSKTNGIVACLEELKNIQEFPTTSIIYRKKEW